MRYAKLGISGKILNIIEVADADCQDAEGNFDNTIGLQFLENTFGSTLFTPILSTSIGLAEINGRWDDINNVFISIKPYDSWTFNYQTGEWQPPVNKPEDNTENNPYVWNENLQTWIRK
jgi:hypothetical protein